MWKNILTKYEIFFDSLLFCGFHIMSDRQFAYYICTKSDIVFFRSAPIFQKHQQRFIVPENYFMFYNFY